MWIQFRKPILSLTCKYHLENYHQTHPFTTSQLKKKTHYACQVSGSSWFWRSTAYRPHSWCPLCVTDDYQCALWLCVVCTGPVHVHTMSVAVVAVTRACTSATSLTVSILSTTHLLSPHSLLRVSAFSYLLVLFSLCFLSFSLCLCRLLFSSLCLSLFLFPCYLFLWTFRVSPFLSLGIWTVSIFLFWKDFWKIRRVIVFERKCSVKI